MCQFGAECQTHCVLSLISSREQPVPISPSISLCVCVEGSDISSCLGSYGDAGSRTGRVREVEMTGRWAHGHRRTSNTHSPMGIRADASACESVAVMT